MTGPVPYGEGFIIIRPDFSRFDDELRTNVTRVLADMSAEFDAFAAYVSDVFDDLVDELVFQMRYVDRVFNRIFNSIARDARECGYIIAASFTLASQIARHELEELEERAHRAFRNIRQSSRSSAGSIFNIFSNIGTRIMSIFGSLFSSSSSAGGAGAGAAGAGGSMLSSLSGLGGSIGGILQAAAMAALIPLAIQLAGAVINLAGALFALPAAIGVAAAAFIPLKIAFNGVGEALSALWEGDPEKIAEAFKKLAPHARVVLREFTQFIAPLKQIGKDIQQGFFVPLEGAVTKLGKTVLPVLSTEIKHVGWAWGYAVRSMIDAISTPEFANAIKNTIQTATRIIMRFGPIIANLLSSVIGLINKGLPYVERFAYWIGSLVTKFADWLRMATQSGQVTGWLDTAWQAGKKLYEVIKQLAIFAGLVFGSFGDEGQDTLTGMAESIAKVNEYLRSSEGQETLHNLGVVIHWVGNAFVLLIASMTGAYRALNFFFDLVRNTVSTAISLGSEYISRWTAVFDWFRSALNAVKSWVAGVWAWIVGQWHQGGENVKRNSTELWNSIVNTVTTFVTNAKNAIMAFPGLLKQWIVDAIHNTAYAIGYAIGSVIAFFLLLPEAIKMVGQRVWDGLVTAWNSIVTFFAQVIPSFASMVGQWFSDMWNSALTSTTNFVNNSVATVSALPGKVSGYVAETRDRAVSKFTELRNAAVERVRSLVSGARDEASKLPGQVSNAISSVVSRTFDIGRDMIYGMINGIKSAAGALWNAARSVVLDAWQGAKDAIKSRSPSKKWAELGEDSAAGYQMGFEDYKLADSISSAIKMPLDAFNRTNARVTQAPPTVNVGGAQLVAYLQIGDRQLQPVVVTTLKENPQEVALAAQQGDTQLARRR